MIRVPQVRVVDPDGKQLGILDLKAALKAAEDAGLDLVEVAPHAAPPVCRIMDYGKHKYLMSKKAHEAKKKQTIIHVKEVKFRCKTEEHDFQFKLKNIIRFLRGGNKVKVSMLFRGREITHTEIGHQMLQRVVEEVREYGSVEQMPRLEGRSMTMIISPNQPRQQQQ